MKKSLNYQVWILYGNVRFQREEVIKILRMIQRIMLILDYEVFILTSLINMRGNREKYLTI